MTRETDLTILRKLQKVHAIMRHSTLELKDYLITCDGLLYNMCKSVTRLCPMRHQWITISSLWELPFTVKPLIHVTCGKIAWSLFPW